MEIKPETRNCHHFESEKKKKMRKGKLFSQFSINLEIKISVQNR